MMQVRNPVWIIQENYSLCSCSTCSPLYVFSAGLSFNLLIKKEGEKTGKSEITKVTLTQMFFIASICAYTSSVASSCSSTLRVSGSSRHSSPATMGKAPYMAIGMA